MKTYDEVLSSLTFKIDERQHAEKVAEELKSRYQNLIDEVAEHPMTKEFVAQLLEIIIDKMGLDAIKLVSIIEELKAAILNSFCNGLVVGIEMEKQDEQELPKHV